jgi:hypothetical protein
MVHYFTHKVRTGPTHQCLCTGIGVFTGSEHHMMNFKMSVHILEQNIGLTKV